MSQNHKIPVPENISPCEFFTRFVPETFNSRVKDFDMSGYKPLSLDVQFDILDLPEGRFGVSVREGARIEAVQGEVSNPTVTYALSQAHFREAVEGQLPWVPLEMTYNPAALRKGLSPNQVKEQMDIMKGVKGQATVCVKRHDGRTVDAKLNFHGAVEPAVVFNVAQKVVEEIERNEYTVTEAFMAGKIKLQGPVEFAMHVMALIPEKEEEE
ncbi:MAG: SCP2 sterol-binding domain-containing protein [Nitrospirae bacterium]|nr:SCP2 sterol-binding domain-containing protein [Nitrospirota bacterium]